jgi:hypothetical protein
VSLHGSRRSLKIGLKNPRCVLVRQPQEKSYRLQLTQPLRQQRRDGTVGCTDAVIVRQLQLKVEPAFVLLRCLKSSRTQTVLICTQVNPSLFEKLACSGGSATRLQPMSLNFGLVNVTSGNLVVHALLALARLQ